MKATILEKVGQPITLGEVRLESLGPHQVRIETGASGVCHSDLNMISGNYGNVTDVVLGHEGAGRVIEVGSEVTLVKPGDRVIALWGAACGLCWQCVRQRTHLCENTAQYLSAGPKGEYDGRPLSASGLGTMAEVMTIHEMLALPVHTGLPDEQLALVGCGVTTGAGAALYAAEIKPGQSVAVVGCGGVGMSALLGARVAGASTIIAVDPQPEKREAALNKFGATHAVDPTAEDAQEQIRELTGGRGVEVALEVAGRVDAMRFAYDSVCRGGTVVFVGALSPTQELTLPANDIHASGKRIIGVSYGNAQLRRDIPRLVGLAESGAMDLSLMVSERVSIDDVHVAFDNLHRGDVIRSVITF